MLEEAYLALAAAGGTAVVQAAGTDAWRAMRSGFARVMGRGSDRQEHAELVRLDQTAEQLEARLAGMWQTRLEVWLEGLNQQERAQVAAQLRELLDGEDSGKDPASNWHGNVTMSPNASGTARVYQVGQGTMHIGDS
jgi:hypothetical protein